MKVRALIVFIFFLAGNINAQTFTGPSLHCATTQGNGDVVINWTNNTCPCGGLPTVTIYASNSGINGPYTALTTAAAGTTSYTQAGANGSNVTWYYYMVSNCGCAGFTSLNSDTINNLNPQAPNLNFVSVNTNGSATINWQKGQSAQTFGYVIYEYINGNYIPIDTVYGRTDTTFTDLKSTAANGSESYTVAAIDSCGNIGAYNTSPQQTIYVTYSLNSCQRSITINWDAYKNWPGVQSYSVYDSVNGAAHQLIGTYSSNTLTATFNNLTNQENLCIWVVANEQGGSSYTSSSNIQCTVVNNFNPVTYCYIKSITTVSNNEIDMTFVINNNASLSGLIVERSMDNVSFYRLAFLPPLPSPVPYADMAVDAATTSYYYRILAVDSCADTTYSSSANNIVISGYAFSTLNNYVLWNAFNFQYGIVLNYNLFRNIDNGPFGSINIAAAPLNFKEDISKLTRTNGEFCYYVIATDSVNYPIGIIDYTTCKSNVICLDQQLTILVPNAIVPTGKNSIFIPKFAYYDITAYDMQIYNRWGGLIFQTNDYTQGWNGTYNGETVEQGVYAYTITVTDSQNHTVQKAGTVMVIR